MVISKEKIVFFMMSEFYGIVMIFILSSKTELGTILANLIDDRNLHFLDLFQLTFNPLFSYILISLSSVL